MKYRWRQDDSDWLTGAKTIRSNLPGGYIMIHMDGRWRYCAWGYGKRIDSERSYIGRAAAMRAVERWIDRAMARHRKEGKRARQAR